MRLVCEYERIALYFRSKCHISSFSPLSTASSSTVHTASFYLFANHLPHDIFTFPSQFILFPIVHITLFMQSMHIARNLCRKKSGCTSHTKPFGLNYIIILFEHLDDWFFAYVFASFHLSLALCAFATYCYSTEWRTNFEKQYFIVSTFQRGH